MPKKSEPKTAPAPEREPVPLEMDVRIHSINTSGKILANASVTLGGCFAVRGQGHEQRKGGLRLHARLSVLRRL